MQRYMTQQRRLLLDYLKAHADQSVSARQIAGELGSQDVSISAVYRNLAALEQDGSIRKVSAPGTRESYYQYLGGHCCEHLHLSCKKCGKTFHMDEAQTEALVSTIAKLDHFALDRADTVLYGLCKQCVERKDGES